MEEGILNRGGEGTQQRRRHLAAALVEMEERYPRIRSKHLVARNGECAGIEAADQDRTQERHAEGTAHQPKEHHARHADADVAAIERVLHGYRHRRHLKAKRQAEDGGRRQIDRQRTANADIG